MSSEKVSIGRIRDRGTLQDDRSDKHAPREAPSPLKCARLSEGCRAAGGSTDLTREGVRKKIPRVSQGARLASSRYKQWAFSSVG